VKYRPHRPLWKHQKRVLKRLWKIGSALLWADTGTGKTKTIVDYVYASHQAGRIERVLVVCPLAVVGVWVDEIKANCPRRVSEQHAVVSIFSRNDWDKLSRVTQVVEEINTGAFITPIWLVVTYDTLNQYAKFLAEEYRPDLVVFDESHYLRNYTAIRTKRALYLARHVPYVVCMSGTPAPKSYADLYYQIKMVDPQALPPTIGEFRDRYCVMGGYYGTEIIGHRNVDELVQRIKHVVIRVRKDELDLPPVIDQRIPVVMDKRCRNLYDQLKKELVVALANGERITVGNPATLVLRLHQVAGGFLKDQLVGDHKLRALQELVENEQGKLVIWARFLAEIDGISNVLKRMGVDHRVITGKVTGEERTKIIKSFQTSDSPRVLVCQIASLGVGVTLHAASTAIFYSTEWAADIHQQAKDRIHRAGQTRTCRYLHIIAQDTVDEAVYEALNRKLTRQEILSELVRRWEYDIKLARAKNLG